MQNLMDRRQKNRRTNRERRLFQAEEVVRDTDRKHILRLVPSLDFEL